jgi:peptide/nickel transport system substrate-binding protein
MNAFWLHHEDKETGRETTAMKKLRSVAVLAAFFAGAVSFGAFAQTPKKGGTMNIAVVAEPPNYDCHGSSTFGLAHPIFPHYSTLIRYDGDWKSMKIEGDLAESWVVAPDGLTFTFNLRKDVKFHDGSPMTSADVKATYERIANPPAGVVSLRRALYEDITSIETPDAHTVIFKVKAPNASMLDAFASPWNCVYSAARLKQDPRFPESNIMGTGAFVFAEHVKGSSWEGKRFDQYFRKGLPYLDGFKMFFVKSSALATGLIGGQFDIEMRGLTPGERDQIMGAKKDDFVLLEGPWSASLMLTVNAKKKPFDDLRVRQALLMALDRWSGAAPMAKISLMKYVGGFTRPGYEYGLTDAELEKLPGYSRDANKAREDAKKLLEEAGVKNLKISFLNRSVGQPYTAAGIFAVDQWRRIGVETDHRQVETKLFFDGLARGEFDVAMDFITDHADDPNLQYVHVVSEAMNNPQSYAKHSDLKIDQLFEAQKRELDPAKRKILTKDFERYAITQAYNQMLFWWQRIVVHHKRINGWKLTPSHYLGNTLEEVWLSE